MSITQIYAALLTFLFLVLSSRVIGLRRAIGIGLGDGGSRLLLRWQRVHGNFAEYVPLGLILMTLAENQGVPMEIIHLTGILLLIGRLVHAYAVGQEPEIAKGRVIGMAITFTALSVGALCNLVPSLIAVYVSWTPAIG